MPLVCGKCSSDLPSRRQPQSQPFPTLKSIRSLPAGHPSCVFCCPICSATDAGPIATGTVTPPELTPTRPPLRAPCVCVFAMRARFPFFLPLLYKDAPRSPLQGSRQHRRRPPKAACDDAASRLLSQGIFNGDPRPSELPAKYRAGTFP